MNYFERVDKLWADLKERFLVDNRQRKYELKVALANCKQWRDTIYAYYTQLQHCEITQILIKENTYQFFMGLNDVISAL